MSKKSPSRTNLIHTSEDESDSSLEASFDSSAVKVGNSSGKTQRKKRGNNNAPDGPRQDGPDLNVMDGELKNYLDLQVSFKIFRRLPKILFRFIVYFGFQILDFKVINYFIQKLKSCRNSTIMSKLFSNHVQTFFIADYSVLRFHGVPFLSRPGLLTSLHLVRSGLAADSMEIKILKNY